MTRNLTPYRKRDGFPTSLFLGATMEKLRLKSGRASTHFFSLFLLLAADSKTTWPCRSVNLKFTVLFLLHLFNGTFTSAPSNNHYPQKPSIFSHNYFCSIELNFLVLLKFEIVFIKFWFIVP